MQLDNVGMYEAVLIAAVAFGASLIGGISGFGTGLILPIVLVPIVGVGNVIPLMAVGMVLTNGSRAWAFWRAVEWAHVKRLLCGGLPGCALGAYSYTLLSSRWICVLLSGIMLCSIVLRRLQPASSRHLGAYGESIAGMGFGLVNGAMTGTGPVLSGILLSSGLSGAPLIATDAVVSLTMGLVKVAVFGGFQQLNTELVLGGLLIGLATVPGAFVARYLLRNVTPSGHSLFMEGVVFIGAIMLLVRGIS
ncbi:putative membrane protein YfcA [Pseudomonas brassicacearum]|uniref:Probable membrane transporter protein n=1 Tax=Pseudomonas brassicacearum TaxID=930166 RepID=A0AAW8M875_9PSED|nr:sulfite exporter TauE/SafE family protein [Pseudomonas brassicacearum]MDR6957928.1 putative membrane protein YfcA [Pseudomonas brassicacearum]